MQVTHRSKIQSLILAAALSTGPSFVSPVSAQAHSYIVDTNGKGLTDLGGGTNASAINDAGQVVGWSFTATGAQHAFITGPNGVGMTDLGTLGGDSSVAYGINDAGQVVGNYTAGRRPPHVHAFITGPNGVGMTDLWTLGGDSTAADINDTGQVVGRSDGLQHAFITGPNGVGMTDLGTLGGSSSAAWGINGVGQVAGSPTRGAQPLRFGMPLSLVSMARA